MQEELKQKEKIQKEYEEKVKEDAKRAIQEAIEIERIKLSKRPIIDLSKEIEKNEDVIKEETIKEENAADEYDEISELTGDMKNDSIDAYIVNDGLRDEKNIVEANNDIDNLEEIDEITGKKVLQNKNVEREINRYPENNGSINNQTVNSNIGNTNNFSNLNNMNNQNVINQNDNNSLNNNMYNANNNIQTQQNLNMEAQAYNRNNFGNSEEFNRTIDAYYNPNKKPFFNLEDYGYILNAVNEEEQKRIQTEMNELYKRKKNNYYDA